MSAAVCLWLLPLWHILIVPTAGQVSKMVAVTSGGQAFADFGDCLNICVKDLSQEAASSDILACSRYCSDIFPLDDEFLTDTGKTGSNAPPAQQQLAVPPAPPAPAQNQQSAKALTIPPHLQLDALNHQLFGGSLQWPGRPFRVLVGGCGREQAAVALAVQLRNAGALGELMCLDTEQSNLDTASALAASRDLKNIQFVKGSIMQLEFNDAGEADKFDLIVADQLTLHGLPDMQKGIAQLVGCLKFNGGMALSVHAELGRMGVAHIQEMAAMVAQPTDTLQQRVNLLTSILRSIPNSNWFARNEQYRKTLELGDPGVLVETFLTPQPTPDLQIDKLFGMLKSGGLRVVGLYEQLRYKATTYLSDPVLLAPVQRLSFEEECSFSELLVGNMWKHTAYVVANHNIISPPTLSFASIPVLPFLSPQAVAQQLSAAGQPPSLSFETDGLTINYRVSPQAVQALGALQSGQTLGQVAAATGMEWTQFLGHFEGMYNVLHLMGQVYLRR